MDRTSLRARSSDLHLEADTPVVVRVRGELQTIGATVTGDTADASGAAACWGPSAGRSFKSAAPPTYRESVAGIRCRVNFFQTVRGMAAAVRLLAPGIKDLRACNLHKDFRKFLEASSGLIIISGPTGSGKSTTLAALIEEINATRARHIVTLESPVEYIFANRQSFIRQREIPTHSPSFEQGITDALRENPDVLVISEMRTPEVMRLTLNAAETGHLVLATMHSATCAEALSRVCMSFPSDIQPSVRAQLADCLVARVLPAAGFSERTPHAGAALRNPASDVRRQGHHPGRKLQPDRPTCCNPAARRGCGRSSATSAGWNRSPIGCGRLPPRLAHAGEAAAGRSAPAQAPRARRRARPARKRADSAPPQPSAYRPPSRLSSHRNRIARGAAADEVIEVPAEEMDLAALAELAKKVVERKP